MSQPARLMPLALSSLLLLGGCVPDVTGAANRAINRGVEQGIEDAVSRSIGALTDRLVSSLLGNLFATLGDVTFTDDFYLDLFSGTWSVAFSGDVSSSYTKVATPEGEEVYDLGFGIRGVNEAGEAFYGLNLTKVNDEGSGVFYLSIAETREVEPRQAFVAVSFDDGETSYSGDVQLTLERDEDNRITGSFKSATLTLEDGTGQLTVNGTFDLPINRAGSLIVAGTETPAPGDATIGK